mmetsp:Transcript_103619/g.195150  ORF Transcript_103619/g.195150 Transcript_103619/m.195150 type:complete len:870 (-) Transcript_103619:169-2778(-)
MPELVGEPVQVTGDNAAARTAAHQEESTHLHSVNCLCCIGFAILLLHGLLFLAFAFGFIFMALSSSELALSLRALRIIPLFTSLLASVGLCNLRRKRYIPGGCECFSCDCPCIPWSLFSLNGLSFLTFLNIVEEFLHEDKGDIEPWHMSVICFAVLSACIHFWFSFRWSHRFAQQSLTQMQVGSEHAERAHALPSAEEGQTEQTRFAQLDSQESKLFEAAYIAAQAVFFIVSLANLGEAVETDGDQVIIKAYCVILLMCFFFRIYRLAFAAPGARVGVLATAFDAFEFSWNGIALGITGQVTYGSFFLNVLLSYMLLFVFPFRRALLVVPLCFVMYCSAAVTFVKESSLQVFCLLGLGLCLNLFAKKVMKHSKWQAFLLIEEKTKLAVQEKVLRFQAEFSKEVMGRSLVHESVDELTSYMGETQSQQTSVRPCNIHDMPQAGNAPRNEPSRTKVQKPYARSSSSAPAMLAPCLSSLPETETANCLPLDALAWVEGEALPKTLADLQPGSRVLCYDRLGGSLKHATLLDAQRKDGPTEWTTVTLADGATLEMTSDHPMQPIDSCPSEEADQAAATTFLSRPGLPVRAADLKAGRHSLVFMQVVPNMVQSVSSFSDTKPRVALTVQQPERHALLVASQGGHHNGAIQTMAVESVNVNASSCVQMGHCQSFLTMSYADEQSPAQERSKAASAPPSLQGMAHLEAHVAPEAPESIYSGSSGWSSADLGDVELGPLPTVTSNHASLTGNATNTGEGRPSYKLSDLFHLRAAGLPSRGSVHHAAGQCVPCIHQNKSSFYGTAPCFKGVFCERCHDAHINVKEAKRLEQRRRRKKFHNAGLSEQCPSSNGDHALSVDNESVEAGECRLAQLYSASI